MSDPGTSRDGYPHEHRTGKHAYAPGSFLERLRTETAAILDGTDDADPHDPHAAGIHLGAVLRACEIPFRITWDQDVPGLPRLYIARTGIEHVTAAGVEADQADEGPDMVSYLLTAAECQAVAAAVEATWEPGNSQ